MGPRAVVPARVAARRGRGGPAAAGAGALPAAGRGGAAAAGGARAPSLVGPRRGGLLARGAPLRARRRRAGRRAGRVEARPRARRRGRLPARRLAAVDRLRGPRRRHGGRLVPAYGAEQGDARLRPAGPGAGRRHLGGRRGLPRPPRGRRTSGTGNPDQTKRVFFL
ncbi:unnamed protein product, partial [Prorocentrum cordatum]